MRSKLSKRVRSKWMAWFLRLRNQKKEGQINSKVSRRKKIMISAEISEIENGQW